MRRFILAACAVAIAGLTAAGPAAAGTIREGECQKARLDAWATYLSCHDRALARHYGFADTGADGERFQVAMSRCRSRYQRKWPQLQAKASLAGSSCSQPRFVDNLDGTVSDNLTGLVWEQKTDDDTLHDKDARWTWSTGEPWTESGTLFTTFLATLNATAFGGSSGWRLPTLEEMQTIVLPGDWPCKTYPCLDPVFGTSYVDITSTSVPWQIRTNAWIVNFGGGHVWYLNAKSDAFWARAVRGSP